MTHITETSFGQSVVHWFEDTYGEENVETQVYQKVGDSWWWADIIVDTGYAHLAVELENDWDSVRHGIGQAAGYAGEYPEDGLPIVVTPAGHIDEAKADRFRQRVSVIIKEFDAEAGGWGR